MGGDCGFWPDQQHFDGQTTNFNSTSAWTRQYVGSQNQLPSYIYPWHPPGQDITLSSLAKPPQLYFNNGEPHGWFYCLSTFRQAMFPPSNFSLKEQSSAESLASQQLPQKQFLVFDQTGDQTTMIYSSGGGAPLVPCLSHWKEKQAEPYVPQPRQDGHNMMMGNTDAVIMDDSVDISKFEDYLGSEMHEDTEELNALMYSDGDSDGDDDEDEDEDEVTSTGHSPSTLTIHDTQDGFAVIREEVASSDGEPTNRQKISVGENGISIGNDHIIVSHGTSGVDVDTEYLRLCDSGKTPPLSGKKRARKDTIGETVRKLQKMIPCGDAATPIEVIDEAINFLISLKLKAQSVGFDSTF